METSEYTVECPKYKLECDIESCPRFLVSTAIKYNKDGELIGSGFCNEHGHRYFKDVPQEKIQFRQEEQEPECEDVGATSPVKIGPGFPFITYCDPNQQMLRMKVKRDNGAEDELTFKIIGDERWHYVLQFVRARTNRVTLKPFTEGMSINLSLVFRNNKGCDHRLFYLYTRTTKGSKAKYWLEQKPLRKRTK